MQAIKMSFEIYGTRIRPTVEIIDAPKKEADNLDFMYKHIGCKTIDCVRFDGVDVWVDDEGLLTSDNVVCEYTFDGHEVILAGSLLVSKEADNLGRTVWFNQTEDMDLMMKVIDMFENCELKGVTNAGGD